MKVRVKFFAILRERAGSGEVTKEIADGSTVKDLWDSLKRDYPRLPPLDRRLLYAVNKEYVDPDHVLKNEDEVAFIPPVSGG